MSLKLQNFVELVSRPGSVREEAERGVYVSWLRRCVPLFKSLETALVVDLIGHAKHVHIDKGHVLFQQGHSRDGVETLRFYVLLRGAASMYVNPFLAMGRRSRSSANSAEQVHILLSSPTAKTLLAHPKSAASKKTTSSKKSKPYVQEVPETDGSDVSDVESVISVGKETVMTADIDMVADVNNPEQTTNEQQTKGQTPISTSSRASKRDTLKAKYGRFVVKYEKGKYFSERAVLDDDMVYSASIVANDDSDFLVLEQDYFDSHIKEQHEKEATMLSNFVDIHPFFSCLSQHAKVLMQISLKSEHHVQGSHIVRQGEPVNRLIFLTSGSAEVTVCPGSHRQQYPNLWPFETSRDVYYNECEWLRESRKRVYERKYEFHGEVSRKQHKDAYKEISVCAIQKREVIGIAEVILNLGTHTQSIRCLQDCDVYTLALKPFRRVIKRNSPETMDIIRKYVQIKLQRRLDNRLDEHVPLYRTLYLMTAKEIEEKSTKEAISPGVEKLRENEAALLKLLDWFKLDKAPLIPHPQPEVIQYKEDMKEKAKVREHVRQNIKGDDERTFFRRGCNAAVKIDKEAMSIHRLKNPMNEVLLKLRMEGTFIKDEEELEELLMRYSKTPVPENDDITQQTNRVYDEEYDRFRYRRHGNRLVRGFIRMLQKGSMHELTRDRSVMSHVLFRDESDDDDDAEGRLSVVEEEDDLFSKYERAMTRTTTHKSIASTYRTLQFERKSITPRTLDMRIKDFHRKYGGTERELKQLPDLKMYDRRLDGSFDTEGSSPLPGGKVFVTRIPCVSCNTNVFLKNHSHTRSQMMESLPMHRVQGYRQ